MFLFFALFCVSHLCIAGGPQVVEALASQEITKLLAAAGDKQAQVALIQQLAGLGGAAVPGAGMPGMAGMAGSPSPAVMAAAPPKPPSVPMGLVFGSIPSIAN